MSARGRRDGKPADPDLPPPPHPLAVPVPDSHTHLDLQEPTVTEAVAAAAAVGVPTLIQIGIDVPSSRWAVATAQEHPAVWATVALHPNEAPRLMGAQDDPTDLESALAAIDALAADPAVRGIGETGLDHYRTAEPGWRAQEESFRRHIDIAKRHAKTLVIHDRDAHTEVLTVLESEGPPDRVVFHCYSGNAAMARVCAERGYLMSFAGNLTYKANGHLREALALAPAELLLVETDAPFLTPMPFRGRPNASYLVPLTVRAMAAVRAVEVDALAADLAANTARMFGPLDAPDPAVRG